MNPPTAANLMQAAWRDVCARWRPLFVYNLFFQALSVVVLAPFTAAVGGWIVAGTGELAVSNTGIVAFLLSPLGCLWIVVAGSCAVALVYAASAGMLFMAWSGRAGAALPASAALILTLRALPNLARLAVLHVRAHLIRLAPSVALIGLIYGGLLSRYDIYYLVTQTPPVWWLALGLAGLVGCVVVWVNGGLYLRWILSMPSMLYEEMDPGQAVAHSEAVMKEQTFTVLRPIVSSVLLLMVSPFVVTGLFDRVGVAIFTLLPEAMPLVFPALVVFLGAYLVAAMVIGFATSALHALVVAHTYLALCDGTGQGMKQPAADAGGQTGGNRQAVHACALLGCGLAAALALAAFFLNRIDLEVDTTVTAHRGSSIRAPENSFPAIELAIQEGADVCELDVQELGDGTIIMIHDTDFRRIAGLAKSVWEVSYGEVKDLDVGSWFAPEFSYLRLKTLSDVLKMARGRILLNLELKFHGHESAFIRNAIEALREADFQDHCIVTSLNIPGLNEFRRQAPEFRVGAILAQVVGRPLQLQAEVLAVSTRMATSDLIDAAHRVNKEVHVWTVNDPLQMGRFADLGVDSIMTDDPVLLAEVLTQRAEMSRESRLLLKVRARLLH